MKDIKYLFQLWNKHKIMFSIVGFFACQILGIVRSQIRTKIILLLIRIFMNLKKCHLQLNNLNKLNFMNTNQPNDLKVGCKSLSNLLKLIGIDVNVENKLKKFEGASKRDEMI